MKTKKNHLNEMVVEEPEEFHFSPKTREKRRPIRNWTKAWVEHETDADEVDDFYSYR
jgi:hypothetical protein